MLIRKPTVLRIALLSGLLTATWIQSHSTARADIVVDGADPTWNHTIQDWCSQHIPEPFRARDRMQVRLYNDRQMEAYLSPTPDGSGADDRQQQHQSNNTGAASDTSDIDGVFEDSPPRVTLRMSGAAMPDMFTFAHEYGHYVWFDLFTGADRKRYEAIYKRQRNQHHLVTAYASTDLEEGFAEAFSFFIADPVTLTHRDADSGRFLEAWTTSHSASSDRS